MELRPDIVDILIKDLTAEGLSQAEAKILYAWLNESAKNKKIYAQMKLLSHKPADLQKLRAEIWSGIRSKQKYKSSISDKTSRFYFQWARVAAILLVCVSIAILVYHNSFDASQIAASDTEVKMIGKVSELGQKLTTILPDGSLVKLNGDSKILFAEEFTGDKREVILYGEAFFEVVKNEQKPFVINTKDVEVEVLGTSFNIKSYPGQESSIVAVATGKVRVKAANQQFLSLETGEKILYEATSEAMVKESFNWEEEYGWKENILVFNKASLDKILDRLHQWYGVEFIQKGQLPDKKFSGRYVNPSLEAVLEGLSYVYEFDYSIDAKTVLLKK